MRRTLATAAAACAAAVALTLLSGCGGGGTDANDPCGDYSTPQACAAARPDGGPCTAQWRAAWVELADHDDEVLTGTEHADLPDAALLALGQQYAAPYGIDPAAVRIGVWCQQGE